MKKLFPLLCSFPLLFATVNEAHALTSSEAAEILSDEAQAMKLATITGAATLNWGPLKPGAVLFETSERYHWESVPASLAGVRFLVNPHHAGVLKFSVASEGLVFMATTTRWNSGGNSSGDWQDEVMLEKDLRRAGWRKVSAFDKLTNTGPGDMIVFFRFCQAGESFRIRTEKYVAPMLLIR